MTKTNVPRLRFNEFSGEWREEKAKEIFVNESIKNHEQEEVLASTQKDGIVFRKDMDIDIKFDKSTLKNYKYVTPGNVVISLRSFQGGFEISDKRGIISPAYTIMSFKDSKNNKDYWKQYLKTYKFIQSLKKVTFGIRDGRSISFTEFSTLKLKFTENKKEQQKIGSFFAKIDKLIELQTEKLEHLKKLKRAYLQKMFPQDGESVPRLRFSGFSGEWQEERLGTILTERNEKKEESKEYPLMAFASDYGIIEKGDRYDRSALVKDVNKKYKITKFNDFIYSSNNFITGSIGLNKYGNATISPVYSIFSMNENNNADFFDVLSKNKSFIYKMIKYQQGVTYGQQRIRETDFLRIKIRIPSPNEQEKIGKYFELLNRNISKHENVIEQLKQQKKAYLQKMFI